jgi:predicted ABC-class ATPase
MSTEKRDPYGTFLATYLQELVETSDADILASERHVAPDFGAMLLSRAKAEAARRRLSRARAGVAVARREISIEKRPTITPAAARARLAEYAQDSRLTLAARNLDELSDEDAIRLCQQLQHLDDANDSPKEDDV